MASTKITVDDSSPLITYGPVGAWVDANDDPFVQSYSGSSLHTTSVRGATASITFNGTGISIFGGKRPNYGAYTFSVDGKVITSGNANSPKPAFNQLLGRVYGLANGLHTSVLAFTGSNTTIDVDSVEFDSQISSAGETVSATTIDDSDPRIKYSGSDWSTNNQPPFINNTLHFTKIPGASATLSFSGAAVAILGTVSPDHANIRVDLDGQVKTFSGGAGGITRDLHTNMLLYYANNLDSRPHTLVVTCAPETGTGPFIDVDSFTIYSTASGTSISASMPAPAATLASSSPASSSQATDPTLSPSSLNTTAKHTSTSTIAGAVVGGIVVLLAFILLAFFLRRRRHRQEKSYHPVSLPLPSTPALPMQRSTTASRTSYRYMRVPKTVPASRFRNVSEVSFSPLRSATDAMDENSSPDVDSQPARPKRRTFSFHWLGN